MVKEEKLELPNTDNPDVMAQAVSIFLLDKVWDEFSRIIDPEQIEDKAMELYGRIYGRVTSIHKA